MCNCLYCINREDHRVNSFNQLLRVKELHYRTLFNNLLGEFDFVKVSSVMDCLN